MNAEPTTRIKKHAGRPDLAGEHPWGDTLQIIFFMIFMGVWISDSFFWHYSTFLSDKVAFYLRLSGGTLFVLLSWYFARQGLKMVFGKVREKPVVFQDGVFSIVRHPIYLGSILFYLSLILYSLSLASVGLWLVIIGFYIYISRYEEKALETKFGKEYIQYQKKVPMLFPRIGGR